MNPALLASWTTRYSMLLTDDRQTEAETVETAEIFILATNSAEGFEQALTAPKNEEAERDVVTQPAVIGKTDFTPV